jgi:hypothetical protein
MDRTFTLTEAQELLPVLESLLRAAMQAKSEIEKIDEEFNDVRARVFVAGGCLLDVAALAKRKAEQDKLAQRAKDAVAEIHATGVQVKDLDIGLLDFPCLVENERILLCWKLGEPSVGHWHGLEEGFKGRKPIDERIAKAANRKP